MDQISKHTLAILVDSEPGVLARISRLFSGKGYTIHSLSLGITQDPTVLRMTIAVVADEKQIRLICNQLRRLICVHTVKCLSPEYAVMLEFAMVKVSAPTPQQRSEIETAAENLGCSVLECSADTVTLSAIGTEDKLCSVQQKLADFGILEIVRTGTAALEHGGQTIYDRTREKAESDYGKNVLESHV